MLDKPKTTPDELNNIQQTYSKQSNKQLYDLIYFAGEPFPIKDNFLRTPEIIWNHSTNQPESITAGKPGIHIYIMLDVSIKQYSLLDIFLRSSSSNSSNQ
jgi:hypothetical protein